MTIKKIKLPSNPYSQLLVHKVTSTFLDKRHDRYGALCGLELFFFLVNRFGTLLCHIPTFNFQVCFVHCGRGLSFGVLDNGLQLS